MRCCIQSYAVVPLEEAGLWHRAREGSAYPKPIKKGLHSHNEQNSP